MKRIAYNQLKKWMFSEARKPLVVRGARQIGKTTTIRQFGNEFKNLVELNFEQNQALHQLFEKNLDPKEIIVNLQVLTKQSIVPGETLLFFDEVQACPRALLSLRYFFEIIPELHVIAAGSLLDFAIESIGLPVGRINFLYMYPMSLLEFLWALEETNLIKAIMEQDVSYPCNTAIHERALKLLGEYIAIGGMPEAVASWRDNKNYEACLDIHHDLISAYQQDFEKYARKSQIKYLEHVFAQTSQQLGRQLQYSKFSGNYRKRELYPALHLLKRANVISTIQYSAGHGIPLGSESNPEDYKVIMLDVAVTQSLLGLTAEQWILEPEKAFINKGPIAEAFIGQELLAYGSPRQRQQLYYWQRKKRGSESEIDYLIAKESQVIPIEVKAGKGTTLKSLHYFLETHPNSPYGIRFSTHNYSIYDGVHSYPLYAVMKLIHEASNQAHGKGG